jgi:N-acetylglutamate synthase-like GNAT family acetyltransferase
VAELDERIIGFALGCMLEKPRSAWRYGYLEWLGVDPSMKGKGIGKRLLNRLTDIFIEHGARMMLVDTEMENVDAIRFFRNQGFGNDVPHVYMSRNLTTHPGYLKKKAKSEQVASGTHKTRSLTQLNGPDIKMDLFEEHDT